MEFATAIASSVCYAMRRLARAPTSFRGEYIEVKGEVELPLLTRWQLCYSADDLAPSYLFGSLSKLAEAITIAHKRRKVICNGNELDETKWCSIRIADVVMQTCILVLRCQLNFAVMIERNLVGDLYGEVPWKMSCHIPSTIKKTDCRNSIPKMRFQLRNMLSSTATEWAASSSRP